MAVLAVRLRLVPLLALYTAIVAATHYTYFGDTAGYAQNVLTFERDPGGGQRDFWDFGHLLLRPLGWLLFRVFGGLFPYTKTGESNLTVMALLIVASVLSGLVAFLLVHALASRFLDRAWAAGFVAVAFVCFHAFLNYVQTGTAYIIGLMWLTLALWAAVRATEQQQRDRLYALLSGAAIALATLFWFPYLVAAGGVVAALLLSQARSRIRLAIVTMLSAAVLICAAYVVPLVALHIHSFAALKQWATESSHGWAQSKRLLRMASGLPRSFVWIGDQGALIKRYLLHDPYAPVTLSQIVMKQFWRILLFYAGTACLLWILMRSIGGRRVLWILAAAAVPVLLFAVLIFEPGSMERYLPIFPFLAVAIAFCLSRYREHRIAAGGLAAFLAIVILLNIAALWRSSVLAANAPAEIRALSLEHKVGPQGIVALVSLSDDLYQLALLFPFDQAARETSLPVYDVVVVANERARVWKQDFAKRALHSIEQGEAVWVSKRLLAARPDPAWGWNEGDDPNVSWKDLRPYFSRFDYSADVGGSDGFLQLADTPQNKALLKAL